MTKMKNQPLLDNYIVLKERLQLQTHLIDERALVLIFLLYAKYNTVFLTARDVVELTQTSQATVARWRSNALGPAYFKLPAKGQNGGIRYRIYDVATFLLANGMETV